MKFLNKVIIMICLLLLSMGVQAQILEKDTIKGTLNESVIITTQFNPIVNEASKLSENPSIFDTTLPNPNFQYEIINKIYPTKLSVEEIKPAKVKGEPIPMLYNGNIKAGIGTYLTPYIEAFYGQTRNRTLLYSANIRHYSSHWSIKDYPKNHFANNDINLYGKKIWDNFYIDAKAYYNNAINYYYGFNNDVLNIKDNDFKTLWNNIGFKTSYASLFRSDDAFHHNLSFMVEDVFGKWTTNELRLNLTGNISKRFELFNKDKQTIGLMVDYSHFVFKIDTNIFYNAPYFSNKYSNAKQSYNTGVLSIKPYFDFKISKFELHTALDIAPIFENKNSFHLIPTAVVYFPIINKKLYFEGGLTGKVERISLNKIRIENPYISPYLNIKPTSHILLYAGLKSTFKEKLGINIEGGIQKFKNHHFFISDTFATLGNMFSIEYDDPVRFYLKARLEYNIAKIFALAINAEYQKYKMDKLYFAYYQPRFTSSLSLQYIIAEKFIIDFLPTFKMGMKGLLGYEVKKLSPIIDINLNVEYRYNDQLSIFLKLNNLAFQRYEEYYNYPSQRFMGMIGASFAF